MELRNFGLSFQKFPVRNGTAFSNNVDCIRQNAKSQFMADSQYLETFLGIFHTILSHSIISIWGGEGLGGMERAPGLPMSGSSFHLFICFLFINSPIRVKAITGKQKFVFTCVVQLVC